MSSACMCVVGSVSHLHEHTEASLEHVGEASRHVFYVGRLRSVWVEDLLQNLSEERTVHRLENTQEHRGTGPVKTYSTNITSFSLCFVLFCTCELCHSDNKVEGEPYITQGLYNEWECVLHPCARYVSG